MGSQIYQGLLYRRQNRIRILLRETYREAKAKVTDAKAYLTQKTYVPGVGGRRCLASYCDEWLQLNRSKVKESTYVKYLSMLEKHVKPKLGSYYIHSLSSLLVEQFSHDLLCKEKLSPKRCGIS